MRQEFFLITPSNYPHFLSTVLHTSPLSTAYSPVLSTINTHSILIRLIHRSFVSSGYLFVILEGVITSTLFEQHSTLYFTYHPSRYGHVLCFGRASARSEIKGPSRD